MTSAHDVWDLARSGDAGGVLKHWSERGDPVKRAWAFAYLEPEIPRSEVEWCIEQSLPALGNQPKSDDVPQLRDAFVEWPLAFLIRGAMQRVGEIPTFYQFWNCLVQYPDFWMDPMAKIAKAEGLTRQEAHLALKWRAANAWHSFIREMHALATLRGLGIPVMSHPIADVVFRVDGWYEKHAFAIYVPNPLFPRKSKTPLKGFTLHHLEAPPQGFGTVWLVPDAVIEQAVERIDAADVYSSQDSTGVLE